MEACLGCEPGPQNGCNLIKRKEGRAFSIRPEGDDQAARHTLEGVCWETDSAKGRGPDSGSRHRLGSSHQSMASQPPSRASSPALS